MFSQFWLAERLGRDIGAILDIDASEFNSWLAYFAIKGDSPWPVHKRWLDATKQK